MRVVLLKPQNGRQLNNLLTMCKQWAAPSQMLGSEAEDYLNARGITLEQARSYGVGYTGDNVTGEWARFANRLVIPNLNRNSQPISVKFRRLDDGQPKYDQPAGQPQRLFNLRALNNAHKIVHITEGELDAISLSLAGVSAIGVPGANAWKEHHHLIFADYQQIIVWYDDDDAGRGLLEQIKSTDLPVTGARVPKPYKDPNQMLAEAGLEALRNHVRNYENE